MNKKQQLYLAGEDPLAGEKMKIQMESSLLLAALEQKILPAVTFCSPDEALSVAGAILEGGLRVMEVPFRTAGAAAAIEMIRKKYPEMYIGAGTLLSIGQVKQAVDAGAQFGLSPGFNPVVCKTAGQLNFPFIPGVMTPSEIELAAESGFTILKLFPAEQLGGVGFLKAMQGPYAHLGTKFIPMGGVSVKNMNDYLRMENVAAVGGSWMATRDLISSGKFNQIKELVKEALVQSLNPAR